jgi:hypothetical protein
MLVSRAIFVAALAFALVVSDVDRSCQVAGLFALATLLEQRAQPRGQGALPELIGRDVRAAQGNLGGFFAVAQR